MPASMRPYINSACIKKKEEKSRQAMEHVQLVPRGSRCFVEISVHQTPQRCCRLDIPASLQQLHQSLFMMHQRGPEESMCLHSQGQHTVSDDFHSCKQQIGKVFMH